MPDQQTARRPGEQESLEVEKDYIIERVKSNYEQIKIYTAVLITVAVGALSTFKDIGFDKIIFDIRDKINFWLCTLGIIVVVLCAIAIRNLFVDSSQLIEKLRK